MKKLLLIITLLVALGIVTGLYLWLTPESDQQDQEAVLYFTTVTHLDRHDDPVFEANEEKFREDSDMLLALADLYEEYGAKLTLEASTDFALAIERFDYDVMSELVERGHGVGAHIDYGIDGQLTRQTGEPVSNVTSDELVDLLVEQKELFEEIIGQPIVHSSGTPSPLDWVSANIEAGFQCHSSIVTYYLVSLDQKSRPPGWTDEYISAGNYHQAFPFDLAERLNPWQMDNATNWVEHDPGGELVAISGETGTHFGFLSEYYNQGITSHTELLKIQNFDEADIEVAKEMVLDALDSVDEDQMNTLYYMYSMKDIRTDYANGFPLMRGFLSWMQELAEEGKIEWASIPEMCNQYSEDV